MNKLGKSLQALKLSENSLILIKKDSGLDDEATVSKIVSDLTQLGLNGLIAVVDDFDDVKILSEPEMNRLGWYRIKTISKLTPKKELPEKEDGADQSV